MKINNRILIRRILKVAKIDQLNSRMASVRCKIRHRDRKVPIYVM